MSEQSAAYAVEAEPQQQASNDDVVLDAKNGLMWTREDVLPNDVPWEKANAAAQACRVGGHTDWRLPAIQELLTLVDYARHNPAIDVAKFPSCKSDWYWSSSPWAGSPADDAWLVGFYDGSALCDHRYNDGFVRAVRSVPAAGECQGVSFRSLYDAFCRARRHKRPSHNQVAFETRWIDGLLALEQRIARGSSWSPSPSTCFVARRPKAREIHAPDFADRVVHHWLVPQLERVFEPGFAFDSFSNRPGKGTHAAVARLRSFVRQVDSGQGGGWYLQLDVANFFNSIHRATLWRILKRRMLRAGVALDAQRVAHALLRAAPTSAGVVHRSTPAERALVPAHKRLERAARGCGLPIGNLSSQFFANVYLDALDQFVKRTLRAPRYLRYVDDFVLVHRDRDQLERWLTQIRAFLRDELRLELKAEVRLRPLRDGIDFLGYVIYPTHTRVRRRVIGHARQALRSWAATHVRHDRVRATPAGFRAIAAIWASYQGLFAHAATWRLLQGFHARFPWLAPVAEARRAFDHRLEGRTLTVEVAR